MAGSLQGSFLIAANHLRDPNFYRSVVMMLEHNDQGAMGLVINRPSAMTIGKALSQQGQTSVNQDPVFVGGPVEPTSLFILHNCLSLGKRDQEVAPGLFLAGSENSFEEVVRSGKSPEAGVRFRLISGYAGWAANSWKGNWNEATGIPFPLTAHWFWRKTCTDCGKSACDDCIVRIGCCRTTFAIPTGTEFTCPRVDAAD